MVHCTWARDIKPFHIKIKHKPLKEWHQTVNRQTQRERGEGGESACSVYTSTVNKNCKTNGKIKYSFAACTNSYLANSQQTIPSTIDNCISISDALRLLFPDSYDSYSLTIDPCAAVCVLLCENIFAFAHAFVMWLNSILSCCLNGVLL